MINYKETREIAAPAEKVYQLITDFDNYGLWNPWIHFAEQNPDGTIKVKTMVKGREKTFEHKILSAEPPHVFHWCDLGWFTHLAYGERIRSIREISHDKSLYQCELRVTGVAANLADLTHGRFMREGLAVETDAIRQYFE